MKERTATLLALAFFAVLVCLIVIDARGCL